MNGSAPAATERTLRAALSFRIDPRSIRELSVGSSEIEKSLEALDNVLANTERDAEKVEEAFTTLASSLTNVGTREAVQAGKALSDLAQQFKSGQVGIEELTSALDDMENTILTAVVAKGLQEELDQLTIDAENAKKEIMDLSNTVQGLESVGMEISGYAKMVTDPLRTFAGQYVEAAGEADDASKAWMDTTEQLKEAQRDLGGVAVDAILPLMELSSSVMEKAAGFAEKYPELVQAVFGIGTALVLANSLQAAVSKGIRLIADAKMVAIETKRFIAAQMNRQAADKMLAAATLNQQSATGAGGMGMGKGILSGLGGLGGLGSALAVGGAITAWAAVGLKAKSISDDVSERTDEMADHWDKFLSETSETTSSAAELADQYNEAQSRANAAFEEGGLVAEVLLDRERLVNANRERLNRALITSATSYEDYEQSISKLNDRLGEGEEKLRATSERTFEYLRGLRDLHDEYKRGEASLRDIAEYQMEAGDFFSQIAGMTTMMLSEVKGGIASTGLVDAWDELQTSLKEATIAYGRETNDAWVDFLRKREEAETEAAKKMERIAIDYNERLTKIEADTQTARERIAEEGKQGVVNKESEIAQRRQEVMVNFNESMAQAEQDYYKSRAESVSQHNLQTQRAEEDHQLKMRRMREDSEVRQTEAIRSRNARALRDERRSLEKERQRAEEDYMIQVARSNEDFARQLAQQEAAFRQQQAARQKNYEEQLAALEEREQKEKQALEDATEERLQALEEQREREIRGLYDANEEKERSAEDHNARVIGELEAGYNRRVNEAKDALDRERARAQDNWKQRRQDQGVYLAGELGEIRSHYKDRLTSLRSWMRRANAIVQSGSSAPVPGRAGGGYVTSGLYRVGEQGKEYVMDNQTTRMAEQLAGGTLTQAGMRGMIGGGGTTMQLTQKIHIEDGRDPEAIARRVREETLVTVKNLLEQVN